MELAKQITYYRKEKGLTQDMLAKMLTISNQAVSKWESGQCYPDISLLPKLAEIFEISLDELFGIVRETSNAIPASYVTELPWNDDGEMRAVIYIGRNLVENELLTQEQRQIAEEVKVVYEGDVLNLTSAFSVNCQCVEGNVSAGGSVSCGNVEGNVGAGDSVSCGNVQGNVGAGDSVNCGNVGENISAGDNVNCGNVEGNISAGDNVNCGNVEGNVSAGDTVECGEVEGNVEAGDTVECGNVEGSVTAGDTVECGDIAGNVTVDGGTVYCSSIGGDVQSENVVYQMDE